MSGLLGALAAGAIGGAGKGVSENAQADMKFNYDQMQAEIKALMDDRIYERGRKERSEASDLAYEREKGLINLRKDPVDQQIKQEKLASILEDKKIPSAVKTE